MPHRLIIHKFSYQQSSRDARYTFGLTRCCIRRMRERVSISGRCRRLPAGGTIEELSGKEPYPYAATLPMMYPVSVPHQALVSPGPKAMTSRYAGNDALLGAKFEKHDEL